MRTRTGVPVLPTPEPVWGADCQCSLLDPTMPDLFTYLPRLQGQNINSSGKRDDIYQAIKQHSLYLNVSQAMTLSVWRRSIDRSEELQWLIVSVIVVFGPYLMPTGNQRQEQSVRIVARVSCEDIEGR